MDPCYRIRLFREWIKQEQKDLTQAKLLKDALGLDKKQYKRMSRIEKDQVPKITDAYAIAKVLGIRLNDLVSENLDPGLVSRMKGKYGNPPPDLLPLR